MYMFIACLWYVFADFIETVSRNVFNRLIMKNSKPLQFYPDLHHEMIRAINNSFNLRPAAAGSRIKQPADREGKGRES